MFKYMNIYNVKKLDVWDFFCNIALNYFGGCNVVDKVDLLEVFFI